MADSVGPKKQSDLGLHYFHRPTSCSNTDNFCVFSCMLFGNLSFN